MAESSFSSNTSSCDILLIILIAFISINSAGFLQVSGKEQGTPLPPPSFASAAARKEHQAIQLVTSKNSSSEKLINESSQKSLQTPFHLQLAASPNLNKSRQSPFESTKQARARLGAEHKLDIHQTIQDDNFYNDFTFPGEQEELFNESSGLNHVEALISASITDNSVATAAYDDNIGSSNVVDGQSDEVERLVRSQIELAASNWVKTESNTDAPVISPSTEKDLASQFINNTAEAALVALSSQNDRQFAAAAAAASNAPAKDKFYPNHNYIFDNNASGPFLAVTDSESSQAAPTNGIGLESVSAHSSDGSNNFKSVTSTRPVLASTIKEDQISKLPYSYRLRDPITSNSSSSLYQDSKSLSPTQTSWPSKSQVALAKAFLRLDKLRAPLSSDDGNHLKLDAFLLPALNLLPPPNNSANEQQISLHSLPGGGNISPKGFNDLPDTVLSNGQQLVGNTNIAATKVTEFPNGLLTDNDSADKIHALSSTKNHLANNPSTATTNNTTTSATLNGNLAARLNANRSKNRRPIDKKQATTYSTGNSDSGSLTHPPSSQAEPLTLNMQRHVFDKVRKYSFSSTSTAKPTLSQTTPLQLDTSTPIFQRRGQTLPGTTLPVTNYLETKLPTTIIIPASTTTLGTSVAPPTGLTPIPYISASNNNRAAANQSVLLNGRPAHHHHIHSHVHSIKPALISIPIPIQSKFNGYDSLVATAAAAAAAAATARAARTRIGSGHQQSVLPAGTAATGPLSRKLHLSTNIPIGGTLASMQANTLGSLHKIHPAATAKGHKSNGALKPSSSIIGQLIDSANKALKQAKGSSVFNLRASSSNQVAPIYSDPMASKIVIPIMYPQSLFTNRGGSSFSDSSSLDSLIYSSAASNQDNDGLNGLSQAQLGSFGINQAPIDEISPIDAYLSALLTAVKSNEEDIGYSLTEPKPTQSEFIKSSIASADAANNEPLMSQAQNNLDWGSNGVGSNSSESEVVFASIGDNSNFLYPLFADKQSNIPDQYITGGLAELQSNFMNALNGGPQAALSEISSAYLASGSQTSDLVSANTPKATTIKVTTPRPSPQSTNKRQPTMASIEGEPKLSVDSKAKVLQHANLADGQQQMQYALTHYLSDELRKLENRKPGISENLPVYLYTETKASSNNIRDNSAKFSQPFHNADLITIDEFRPISNPHYYSNLPDNSKFYDHIDSNEETRKPAIIKLSAASVSQAQDQATSHFGQSAQKSQQQRPTIKSSSIRGHVLDEPHQNINGLIISSRLQNGATQVAGNNMNHSPAHLIQLLPQQHILNNDLVHHTLIHAGSSLKPHIMAASDLINYHKQHLLNHHHSPFHLLGQSSSDNANYHQTQDMATSETARFAVSSTNRGSLLLHFWPLALAMLPLMIIVAIVAQLVMVAPLIMFAMATLSVSRFAAALVSPFSSSHNREENSNSILMSSNKSDHRSALSFPSQKFLTSVLGLNSSSIGKYKYDFGSNSTTEEGRQRIKRALD